MPINNGAVIANSTADTARKSRKNSRNVAIIMRSTVAAPVKYPALSIRGIQVSQNQYHSANGMD
jgi:hypothetical protein